MLQEILPNSLRAVLAYMWIKEYFCTSQAVSDDYAVIMLCNTGYPDTIGSGLALGKV
jgi:hypothetical protein